MKRTVLCALLLAAAAAAAIDWREVASVRVPEGEAASVAVDGETVWKRVPYDAEIEFLQASGTQYIDLGVPTGPLTRTETDIAVTDWDAGTYSLTGSGSSRHAFGKGWSGSSSGNGNAGKLYFGLGAQNLATSVSLTSLKSVRHTYWIDAQTATAGYDSASFALSSAGTISTNTFSAALLAQRRSATGIRGQMAAQLYAFRLYESGALVIDGIPVRAGTTGYLYDRVSGQLYGNAGTGAFVLGPDKN